MAKLLIAGAGGHGKVVADTALEMNQWDEIAFLDDRFPELTSVLGYPVLGKIADSSLFQHQFPNIVVAIGDNALRVQLLQHFHSQGFTLPSIISPSSYISRHAEIGQGTVIFAQVAVNASSTVGYGCIINTGAVVDHDCKLGNGVHLSPGTHLAGAVKVGDFSWIGTGASVIPGISIGEYVIIGAGTVVLSNISDSVMVAGVPGKIKKYFGRDE